ncbi:Putative lipid-transfer DIR1 -like protein [Gossypium arboreum]|uniref:Bifunctional inhibitor/plant lipid transfer protein/seed storage helical domain-containing protein n=6 Tax=Gossypium TaxID=3633 RepID=A0A2P5XRX9_GOSBA|nr:putative lipid-transfer protein DIR1 [Gossypium arboreum]XP_040932340.1 putative lipid-transfer protein DIR1 [Gossypium hirsutum]KAB2096106.1 hypothetical protein ES319_A01G086400v1 [Gossypium barbadense]TYH30430.1 hypothetical protein ES288_A01G094600v1 [Gossypium darwinii]TYI42476.1 hypothetical protein ES332_A01G101600v1 [Gossypium tomentosum]KAG4213885.1 hypothetical protein ERO13_A01G085500v2 [Gossypium hirsutum]KAK5844813.1 hypothetical protein PVK06_000954 [Gossypium arboreum]
MAMATEKLLVQCLVATLLLIAAVEGAKETTICNIPLKKLEQCKPAVTGKNPPPPTKECCSLIKQADLTCLCNYKDALPAFQIEPSRAFALPQKCKCKHPVPPQCKP